MRLEVPLGRCHRQTPEHLAPASWCPGSKLGPQADSGELRRLAGAA